MLMLFFSFQVASWGIFFFCEVGFLECFKYGNSLFFSKSFTHDYFVYRPSLKDSVDWFILMTNLVFSIRLFVNIHKFHAPYVTGYSGVHNLMRITFQVIAYSYLLPLSWIDDSFVWCIRYTRRLCNKNMKPLALTE